jgi:hypothetical protein
VWTLFFSKLKVYIKSLIDIHKIFRAKLGFDLIAPEMSTDASGRIERAKKYKFLRIARER